MAEEVYHFSPPENMGSANLLKKTVNLFRCHAFVMGETKYFWQADYKGVIIASACDSREECLDQAKQYLQRTA